MKKMEREAWYWFWDMCKSVSRPSILALPMLVRSRKEMR